MYMGTFHVGSTIKMPGERYQNMALPINIEDLLGGSNSGRPPSGV